MEDWLMLTEALQYYQQRGYRYVDVPWIVPDEIARMTFDGEGLACQAGTLIGSAEQGFLALDVAKGDKLMSASPCFRNEPVVDELHRLWFMKVELYLEGSRVQEVLADALKYAQMYLDAEVVSTAEGFDIMASGIEIGSYGERSVSNRRWTYGTGIALPRFTMAMDQQENMAQAA